MKKIELSEALQKMTSPFIKFWSKSRFGFSGSKNNIASPFLMIANKGSRIDNFLIAQSFSCPVYVACNKEFESKYSMLYPHFFVCAFDDAIMRKNQIQTFIDKGKSVCLFAQKMPSLSGACTNLDISIAKLAKELKIPVVLAKIEGTYFTTPAWSKTIRKGNTKIEIVEVVSPMELERTSTEMLLERILNATNENAYERQNYGAQNFFGRRYAEGIETLLFACPECGSVGTIRSSDNKFWCSACGDSCNMLENGHIVGGHYERLDNWCEWQKGHVFDILSKDRENDEVILHSAFWELSKQNGKGKFERKGCFEAFVFCDRLLIANKFERTEFCLDQIQKIVLSSTRELFLKTKTGEVFRLRNCENGSALAIAEFLWTMKSELYRV